jgi:hypothetical protein
MINVLWCHNKKDYTCGLAGSTDPLVFDVSGVPSPFELLSGLFFKSVECLVSALDKPSCFPDCSFFPRGFFEAAGYEIISLTPYMSDYG